MGGGITPVTIKMQHSGFRAVYIANLNFLEITFMKNLSLKIIILLATLMTLAAQLNAQDAERVETLFNSDTKLGFQWSPAVKFNSIQGDIGSLLEVNGGVLINNSTMVGLTGGINFGHPRVNYGYFGLMARYAYNPSKLVHFSGQAIIAYGATKDYEQEKSSLFDNFWNIYGTGFYMIEPGVNLEINLRERTRFVTGVSYRFVTGLDKESPHVSITNVTNKEMSGLNVMAGFIFRGGKKD